MDRFYQTLKSVKSIRARTEDKARAVVVALQNERKMIVNEINQSIANFSRQIENDHARDRDLYDLMRQGLLNNNAFTDYLANVESMKRVDHQLECKQIELHAKLAAMDNEIVKAKSQVAKLARRTEKISLWLEHEQQNQTRREIASEEKELEFNAAPKWKYQ